MFSKATPNGQVSFDDGVILTASSLERRQITATSLAVFVLAGFGLFLPTPSAPAASKAIVVQSPATQVAATPAVAPVPVAVVAVAVPSPEATPNRACPQQSWPYVCADKADSAQKRVRVISTDRNAPASIVVAVQEAAPATRTVETAAPSYAAPSSYVTASAPVTAPVAAPAVAQKRAIVQATFSPPAQKRVARSKPTRAPIQVASDVRRVMASNEDTLGQAMAYDASPRHRVDSYPWAGSGLR